MVLPQFGISSAVRVCDNCFRESKQIDGEASKLVEETTSLDHLARLNISCGDTLATEKETTSIAPLEQEHECTCGMPLCICKIQSAAQVVPDAQIMTPVYAKSSPVVSSGGISTIKKAPVRSSYGNELPSLFFSTTKSPIDGGHSMLKKYELTGEGMWEAIKNGDAEAVKDLLASGVDPNHKDKQGMSLLHLAAVFNFTEIAFLLMDAGANTDAKNAQGETPLDCAPVTLQYKMQQKLKCSRQNNSDNHLHE
ncbi:hypothetical protein KP509_26G047200 [Ceratopteris richardii]|nr:hypothetical protein KP509_26G047200 [Ceratopteris richardii]